MQGLQGTDAGPPFAPAQRVVRLNPRSRTATHDPRWPAIVHALAELRAHGRRSVRIVDADCGAGCILLAALRHARAIGFVAIEGRGLDGSPALIGRACSAADRLVDPAIGVAFEVSDVVEALRQEQDLPADLVLWKGTAMQDVPRALLAALRSAGDRVIATEAALIQHKVAA